MSELIGNNQKSECFHRGDSLDITLLQAADVPLRGHVAALPGLLQLAHRHAIDLRRAFEYRVRFPTPPLVTRVEHFSTTGGAV